MVTQPAGLLPVTDYGRRADLYASVRRAKAERVRTDSLVDEPGRVHRFTLGVEERLAGGGSSWWREAGLSPSTGGLGAATGVAVGVRYDPTQRDSALYLGLGVAVSHKRYWGADVEAGYAGRTLSGLAYAQYRHRPEDDFYGLGMQTPEDDHSNYLRNEVHAGAMAGLRPLPGVLIGTHAAYAAHRPGSGKDDAVPRVEVLFGPADLPGFGRDLEYVVAGAFLAYDRRSIRPDDPFGRRYLPARQELRGISSDARHGVYAAVELDHHLPTGDAPFGFTRLDVESQQFIPFRHGFQILALRQLVALTKAREGEEVPFYLMPSIGGSNTLRGFDTFRFTDRNALLLTAELRYQVWLMLDMAVFADAGQVFATRDDLALDAMEVGYGLSFRLRGRTDAPGSLGALIARLDLARSREGYKMYVKLGTAF